MIRLVWIVTFLLMLGGVALAEDLSKLISYAVTYGASPSVSPTMDLSKIITYAVVSPGGSTGSGSGRGLGSLSLGIN